MTIIDAPSISPARRSSSRQRIAIIDGAMGTTIRTYGMKEADIRGERFADSKKDLLNNGDLFSLTQPKMICDIHRRFLEAGADIIETNTFGATSITQSEFFVDDPREHGGRKDPAFYQKIIEDQFLERSRLGDQRAVRAAVPRVGRSRRERRRQAALRRRRDRAAHRLALELARCRRRRLSRGHVRSGEERPTCSRSARSSRAARTCCSSRPSSTRSTPRRRSSPSEEVFDADGKRAADDDLGRGGARRRDDDLRADRRGALERGQAREAALGRAQLLARPRPDVPVPLRAVGEGQRRDLLLSERRAAQPALADRLRFGAGRTWRRYLGEFADAGLVNIAGGCCGNTPEHIAAIAKALGQPKRRSRRHRRRRRAMLPRRDHRPRSTDAAARCACRARSRSRSSTAST